MRLLYYNCVAGICGDMNLGAMLDLGVNPQDLVRELERLPLEGWQLHSEQDVRSGISGTRCDVILESDAVERQQPHSHDHHSHVPTHAHEHSNGEHGHGAHGHQHAAHRTFREIREMIEGSGLHPKVKADAIAIFQSLAEAEGAVHNKPADAVHFHEVGAVDSILDIVGAAVCWHLLEVDAIASSAVELGGGTVQCAHGRMPVPAPATARLLEGVPVRVNGTNKEATTPTGAAILMGKQCRFETVLSGRQLKAGTGIGQRKDPNLPNVLHVALLDVAAASPLADSQVWEVAVNLDDMMPEHVAFLCEQLLDAGALDVWQTAATFKKGRLGVVVSALAGEGALPAVEAAFMKHSRSLGLRRCKWERVTLPRSIETVDTTLGPVRLKIARDAEGRICRRKPEYEDCKALALKHDMSLREVQRIIEEVLALGPDRK
ncbi:nickel pincer cofactor biosynthesis protein LarC [Coraliomargarita parva]|uniref:nickel pincer cofactor biosynthesis protein LarC n=1 Tax=Coraliomargarita parva TaxID=3014050 RepID=UPI0022B3ACBF|nr:nickel pincer cofactor biosynthesis protein LarC [Coraliomargarita parva]